MTIISDDGNYIVSVGSSTVWWALYSTIRKWVEGYPERYQGADKLFQEFVCPSEAALEVAVELDGIRSELSKIKPDRAVYDINHPEVTPPWKNNISPNVLSCADLFTTEDGKNLIAELIGLLRYSNAKGTTVMPVG